MLPNLVADALVLTLASRDRKIPGRVHPVTLWRMITARNGWHAIAPRLFGCA
ncbi:hypothetical protein [Novosphingobium sp.]|uniref:hypothetical protein n=1 Tax=Novosphingobium sp. TaxID=1874826 RepID=UPI002600C71A|nr:hypothetical protein [Novosphingobium sp.]